MDPGRGDLHSGKQTTPDGHSHGIAIDYCLFIKYLKIQE